MSSNALLPHVLEKRVVGIPDPPPELGDCDLAKRYWYEIAPQCVGVDLYHPIYARQLALYCMEYARYWRMRQELMKQGETQVHPRRGNIIANPLVGMVAKTMDSLIKLGDRFGLTPLSKTRIDKMRSKQGEQLDTEDEEFGL